MWGDLKSSLSPTQPRYTTLQSPQTISGSFTNRYLASSSAWSMVGAQIFVEQSRVNISQNSDMNSH